ncbi:MAG: hypothetical protein KIT79_14155 [Deltaproteobacteria bacterium]|nr:hypothetical protein [Deltaproteobacteria bacterium]
MISRQAARDDAGTGSGRLRQRPLKPILVRTDERAHRSPEDCQKHENRNDSCHSVKVFVITGRPENPVAEPEKVYPVAGSGCNRDTGHDCG